MQIMAAANEKRVFLLGENNSCRFAISNTIGDQVVGQLVSDVVMVGRLVRQGKVRSAGNHQEQGSKPVSRT